MPASGRHVTFAIPVSWCYFATVQQRPDITFGDAVLDDQHRTIVECLDALVHAIRHGSSRDEVARTLATLRRYVAAHFSAEEALLRAAGFPGLADHVAEHERFARELDALDADFESNGATPRLVLAVSGTVSAWLDQHLFRADRAVAEFLSRSDRAL